VKLKVLLTSITLIIFATISFGQNYYLGVGDENSTSNTCAACHKQGGIATPVYDEWKQTIHAVAQDSLNLPYFGYDCLECHNTGWDPNTANYGADEYVVKDSTHTPNYVITDQTNWDRVKNVQCESCHGPLGNQDRTLSASHWDFQTVNVPNYKAEVCGECHQDEHHPYFEEWSESAHSVSNQTSFVVSNKRCVKCHVAQNFVMFAKDPENYRDTILVTGENIEPITCVTCHDPHSKKYPGQLRFDVTGSNTICDECHTSEIDVVDINATPHHTTSEVLSGSPNFGFRYEGETYQNSAHTYAATERCINCHVFMTPFVEGEGAKTGHTFEPRVEACADCHTDYFTAVDTSIHETRFDYRGVQSKTDSLMTVLENKLSLANSADSLTDAFKEARYNLLSVQQEGSHGIHNTKLVQKLLQDAITRFNPTDVEKEEGIPTQYTLSQNYPNPFNPTTQIKFSLPKASNVKLTIYDAIGKEVMTLVDQYMDAGNYTADWNASKFSSGIYLYRIEADNFIQVKKMILIK